MDWYAIYVNTAQALFNPVTIAFALAALGLAVHFGFVGLLNFGIAGFMAVGGYGYAISALTFGFPWWGSMLSAVVAALLFALVLGLPTLQLRGDYLAIVTIASAEIVRLLLVSQPLTA
jgi:ABC-type branched-chain amino acid transport system, permease component